MMFARIGFTMLLGLGIALGSMQISWAQILGTPGQGTSAEPTTAGVQQAGGTESGLGEIKQTNWPSIPLPKISMPQITLPRLWPSTEDDRPALLTPFVAGAAKVSAGTKKAWEGTKDIFSVGSGKKTSNAPRKPSIWKRLIGRAPQKQYDDGPRTVGEFMSQERLNP